jgi:hypothetical protein
LPFVSSPVGIDDKIVLFSHTQVVDVIVIITSRGRPELSETSKFPNLPDNLLTDGPAAVSLTHRPDFTPHAYSWYPFL